MTLSSTSISRVGSIINETDGSPSNATYIVLGYPHGGTTLIAGLLRIAGIFMGTQIATGTNEDILFRTEDVDLIRRTIRKRNADHSIWGWKCPAAVNHLQLLENDLRNPRFISITRDPFASTRRRTAGLASNELPAFEHWIDHTRMQLNVLTHFSASSLLIGYERCLESPDQLIAALAQFTGQQFSEQTTAAMLRFIQPQGGYTTVAGALEKPISATTPPRKVSPSIKTDDALTYWGYKGVQVENNRWELSGHDPFVHLDDRSVIRLSQENQISIRVSLENGMTIKPKLYLDIGFGYNEQHTISLGEIGTGEHTWEFDFPENLAAARLNPSEWNGVIPKLELFPG